MGSERIVYVGPYLRLQRDDSVRAMEIADAIKEEMWCPTHSYRALSQQYEIWLANKGLNVCYVEAEEDGESVLDVGQMQAEVDGFKEQYAAAIKTICEAYKQRGEVVYGVLTYWM